MNLNMSTSPSLHDKLSLDFELEHLNYIVYGILVKFVVSICVLISILCFDVGEHFLPILVPNTHSK